jgi:hypothetical protein
VILAACIAPDRTTVRHHACRHSRRPRAFLKAVKHPERIIALVTSGGGMEPGEAKDFDAITSASKLGALDVESAALIARLQSALSANPILRGIRHFDSLHPPVDPVARRRRFR